MLSSGWMKILLVVRRRLQDIAPGSFQWLQQVSLSSLTLNQFLSDSTAVFSMLYGFIGMRENISHTH